MLDDLISRQAAIDACRGMQTYKLSEGSDMLLIDKAEAMTKLMMLPSAQPERKKGKWIRHNTYHGDDTSGYVDPDWRCSECGKQAMVNEWMMYDLSDFCPNCGADMRGKEE